MKSKLTLYIVTLCLLSSLLLFACTLISQPAENTIEPAGRTSAPSTMPAAIVTSPPANLPLETEDPQQATTEPQAADCPITGETLYVNNLYGYCFAYPEGYTVQVQTAQGPALVGPVLNDGPDPLRVVLTISARPVPEYADLGGLVSGFLSQSYFAALAAPPERTTIPLGGESAEALDPVPGRLSSRVVNALHGATLYQLYFTPTDMQEAEPELEELYKTVIASFAFFPVAPQPPAAPERANYFEFGRIFSFTYDPKLALIVEPRTVEAVPVSTEVMFAESHPAFVQFRFLGYDGGRLVQLPYPFQTPQLMIFPTQEFAEFGADEPMGFPQQLEDLRRLLEEQPEITERCTRTSPVSGELALPFLPWLNSAQVFCAQPQYVEFNGGKGIRYLTAFSQGIDPLMDPSIFYTFQGLSEDGEMYYSAVFPVLTGIFPLEAHTGVDGQLPQSMTAEQLSALTAQPGHLFQPALGQLDGLVSSLEVEK